MTLRRDITEGFIFTCTALVFFGLPLLVARWLSSDNPRYDLAIYFGTGLVVLWYTLETRGMRHEMMATRIRLETPDILVRLESVANLTGFFDVVVENASEAPAFDINFKSVPDLPLPPGNRRTTEIGFLKHGIRYLAPRQAHRAFFLAYSHLNQDEQNATIEFAYTFKNARGNEVPRSIAVNLSLYYDTTRLGRGFEADLLTEMHTLNQVLRDIERLLRGGLARINRQTDR